MGLQNLWCAHVCPGSWVSSSWNCKTSPGLCENNDKFAVDRSLNADPRPGDVAVIHDSGAHGHSMGFNYNGKPRSAEPSGEGVWETDGKRMGNIGTLLGLRCQVHGFAGKLRKSNGWSAFCFFGYNSFPIRFFWIGTSHHFWSNLPCCTACCTRACCQGICLDAMAQCCEYVVQRL